jgi:prepilin-type N-terminal cleavage/methylation domain-containing protein
LRRDSDSGFTLLEMMVVVLIIAVLIALALPVFVAARQRANDRATQSDLTTAVKAELSYHVEHDAFTADQTALRGEARGLVWTAWPTAAWDSTTCRDKICVLTGTNPVQAGSDPDTVCLLSQSPTGSYFEVMAIKGEKTRYFHGLGDGISKSTCDRDVMPTAKPLSW